MNSADPDEMPYLAVYYLDLHCLSVNIIGIYHECEGRIENSVSRIAVWHHKAYGVMTNGDPEGRIFISYPHTNNGFFFLLTTHVPLT